MTLPNLVCLLPCQVADPISTVIPTQLTILTTVNATHTSAAAPLPTCAVVLAVVNTMPTITANTTCQVITTAATMLVIIFFASCQT